VNRRHVWGLCALFAGPLAIALAETPLDIDEEKTGGDTTVHLTGLNAFSMPAANLDDAGRRRFAIGNSFFRRNWVTAPSSTAARDGLGPLFIARSCSGCHPQGGRGALPALRGQLNAEQPVALVFKLSVPGTAANGAPNPEPTYGEQFHNAAVRGVKPDGKIRLTYRDVTGRFADGQPYTLRAPRYEFRQLAYGPMDRRVMVSPRIASQLIGLGLLEAIPVQAILDNANEQAQRSDAIKGVPNYVWDAFAQERILGRFGWKANAASLAHQTAHAFQIDMGITSRLFPDEPCTRKQAECMAAPHGNRGSGPEIEDEILADVIFNQAVLAPPARRDIGSARVRGGEALFRQAQCDVCHRPSYVTGIPASGEFSTSLLAHQKIFPYTDLLLHDMGPGLADERPDFVASGRQWRTPPLWGIGLLPQVNGHQFLLHDGRARNVMEAILWHAGEAEASRQHVLRMTADERHSLLSFINSL